MVKRFGASVSTLALLTGFIAAPYTHLHLSRPAAAGESHGHALLHSHVTSHKHEHDHDAPAGHGPHEGDGTSVDNFVFQPVKNQTLADGAAELPRAVDPQPSASAWTSISRPKPVVYGSPPILPSASRAPPFLSPAAA